MAETEQGIIKEGRQYEKKMNIRMTVNPKPIGIILIGLILEVLM